MGDERDRKGTRETGNQGELYLVDLRAFFASGLIFDAGCLSRRLRQQTHPRKREAKKKKKTRRIRLRGQLEISASRKGSNHP